MSLASFLILFFSTVMSSMLRFNYELAVSPLTWLLRREFCLAVDSIKFWEGSVSPFFIFIPSKKLSEG